MREARRFVAEHLAGVSRSAAERVVLLVSELAANVVMHAGTWFSVAVETTSGEADDALTDAVAGTNARAPDVIHVEVSDDDERLPVVVAASPDEATGRGLAIVDADADAWGVVVHPNDGKTIWFEVQTGTDREGSTRPS